MVEEWYLYNGFYIPVQSIVMVWLKWYIPATAEKTQLLL